MSDAPALASPDAPRSLDAVAGRTVVVWSYGIEGRAAVAALGALARPPASITVVDDRPGLDLGGLPAGVRLTADRSALAEADVVIASPGMSRYWPEHVAARHRGALTTGTALLLASPLGPRTLAITGSKGKSTTTKLAHHLLAGLAPAERVAVGGNLGLAPIAMLVADPAPQRLVLEVSSFQAAETADPPGVGILTALFPDHLDWHGDLPRYIADKCNLFAHGTTTGVVAVDGTSALVDEVVGRGAIPGAVRFGGTDGWHVDAHGDVRRDRGPALLSFSETGLIGAHNGRNLCGVLTALDALGLEPAGRMDEIRVLLQTFRPLPHRLEIVGQVVGPNGTLTVVDDGMSSNPDAAVAALGAFDGRAVTILLGGSDRGVPFEHLAAAIAQREDPTAVVVVPACGARIATAIAAADPHGRVRVVHAGDLAAAVAVGLQLTPDHGVLCLSPGAPSFTEFAAGYKARSARFRALLGVPPAGGELD